MPAGHFSTTGGLPASFGGYERRRILWLSAMWIAVIAPALHSFDDGLPSPQRQIVLSGETMRNEVFLGKQR